MEEFREQPITMPAHALNPAFDDGAMSEIGSQNQDGELGKFKSVQALMDAYDSLQAEFTKKCQMLSQLKKEQEDSLSFGQQKDDQKEEVVADNQEEVKAEEDKTDIQEEQAFDETGLQEFLSQFGGAQGYEEEIKQRFPYVKSQATNPYAVAWADVLLSHIKEKTTLSDPIINQYVLSDENIRNKIIEDYLESIKKSQPPIVISSQSGERLSGVLPDSPKTLAEAKSRVEKMFS